MTHLACKAYSYVDMWAEAAQAKKSDFWAEEEHGEFVPPPWEIMASTPPTALHGEVLGTPRAVERKLSNEDKRGEENLAKERALRPKVSCQPKFTI